THLGTITIKPKLTDVRYVIIDISMSWKCKKEQLTEVELIELAKDIHLLIDIYWLDKVKLRVDESIKSLYNILKIRLKDRIIN
ncbi:hypothetical protein, partial [Motilimonas sp. KMU-193]|uniref:hypothetical protein n=1 Tax=Motilimonas sp. KMU-193 TaxID=3388668 RepID=UPI00396B43BB